MLGLSGADPQTEKGDPVAQIALPLPKAGAADRAGSPSRQNFDRRVTP